MSKYAVFSGPYFSVFGLNTGKYAPEKTPCLDTFYVVHYSIYGHYFEVRSFKKWRELKKDISICYRVKLAMCINVISHWNVIIVSLLKVFRFPLFCRPFYEDIKTPSKFIFKANSARWYNILRDDIVLIKFDKPFLLHSFAKLACLPKQDDMVKTGK